MVAGFKRNQVVNNLLFVRYLVYFYQETIWPQQHSPNQDQILKHIGEATIGAFPDVVCSLVSILGRKQTAYIASVKDARAIDRWLENATPQKDVEQRIRLAYHIAGMPSNSTVTLSCKRGFED